MLSNEPGEGLEIMSRATFVQGGDQQNNFIKLRETLLQDRFREQLSKPLAFWALPNDRRLPLAFLNRTVGELINTPFEELSATPGVGAKKINSLVKLLMRATKDGPPTYAMGPIDQRPAQSNYVRIDNPHGFDACLVPEALWSKWTATIRELRLGNEPLGRIAATLSTLPTVIWTKTLGEYENLTLAQIRGLRTHGEKRVRCVMEVVHRVDSIAQKHRNEGVESIRQRLRSQRIVEITQWLNSELAKQEATMADDVMRFLAEPILKQIQVDCGETVYRIAHQRVGIDGQSMSVREQAQTMGVTRARIYQLLDDCHKVIDVRWPEGKHLLDRMTAKYGAYLSTKPADPALFLAVRQLCFPDRNSPQHRRMDDAGASNQMPPHSAPANISTESMDDRLEA